MANNFWNQREEKVNRTRALGKKQSTGLFDIPDFRHIDLATAAEEFKRSFPGMTFAQIRQFVERGGPLRNVQLREDILAAIGRSGLEQA